MKYMKHREGGAQFSRNNVIMFFLIYILTYPSSSNDVFKYFASVKRTPSAFVLVSLSLPAKSHLKKS